MTETQPQVAPGRLITLEGMEGAGKSTMAAWLDRELTGRGLDILRTREPGGSPVAERLREVLLANWEEGMPGETELLLMFAARAAHLQATMKPALAAGQWVICDRFTDASYAYQGAGRGLDHTHIAYLEQMVLGAFHPDLVLVFDLPVEVALQRTVQRGNGNRFDHESAAFYQRVREAYLGRAAAMPERYAVLDARKNPDEVQEQIMDSLKQLLQYP